MNRFNLTWVTALVVALCSGCAMTHGYDAAEVTPNLENLPATTKTPVSAGVYYSPQFAGEHRTRTTGPTTFDVPIGAASVQVFDELFPKVFAKTTRISSLSPEEITAKGVDVAISPTLEHFDFRIGFDPDSDRWRVVYRLTLYSREGVPVASWVVSGNGPEGFLTTSVQNDLKNAATQFLGGFEREAGPALAAIARSREAPAAAIAPGDVVVTATVAKVKGLDPKVAAALQRAGVAAIEVTARGATTRRGLVMRASDTRLQLRDGQLVEPSSVSAVLNVLDNKNQALSNFMLTGQIGAAMSSHSQQEQREMESGNVTRSLFRDRKLSNDREESGIVLFRLPKGAQTAAGATLRAWIVDPAAADGVQLSVAIR